MPRSALTNVLASTLLCLLVSPANLQAAADDHPHYRPYSRSPEPIDILSNAYGASRSAPAALAIGEFAPEFAVPRAGGGEIGLNGLLSQGTLVLVFYRGHW